MRLDIPLPHINYTVKVRPFKKPPPDLPGCHAYIDRVDNRHSVLYLPKKVPPGLLAHELVHVLQHICKIRDMDFLLEEEHMAYTMQYLMGEILGWVWA